MHRLLIENNGAFPLKIERELARSGVVLTPEAKRADEAKTRVVYQVASGTCAQNRSYQISVRAKLAAAFDEGLNRVKALPAEHQPDALDRLMSSVGWMARREGTDTWSCPFARMEATPALLTPRGKSDPGCSCAPPEYVRLPVYEIEKRLAEVEASRLRYEGVFDTLEHRSDLRSVIAAVTLCDRDSDGHGTREQINGSEYQNRRLYACYATRDRIRSVNGTDPHSLLRLRLV